DGGDLVTFALMIQNTGSSPGGAFDITIRDELQSPDFQIPGHGVDGINLSVTYGDGTPVSYTALNAADPVPLFGDGIEIVDPGPAQGACEAPGHTAGRDIIIITYDLRIRPGIAPNTVITNTGHIMSYSNTEGGPDFLPNTPNDDLTERASTTIGSNAGKSGTPTALTVGQTYRQRITVEIPPNTSMQEWPAGSGSGVVILRDSLLSNGMHGLTSTATFTPGASCSNTNFSDPTFQSAISVTTTDTGPGEDIIWSFPAPIDNTGGTSSCGFTVEIDVLIMDADFYDGSRNWLPPTNNSMVATDNAIVQYSDGSRNLQFSSGTYSINVDQPVINLTKTITAVYESDGVTPRPAGQELRRGDIIVWTVRMENVGESGAYEVSFEDQLSVNQAFVSGSAFLDNGAGNPANAGNGVQDAGEISLANPTTSGSPTVAPGQLLNFHYPAYEDLAPGDTFYVSYRTQILDTMDLGTVLNNNADADWSTLDGNQTYERVYDDSAPIANDSGNSGTDDQDSDSAQVINLTIDKSFSPNIVGASPPGTATMTLTINNPNTNTNLTGVSVTDNLPAGLEVASPPNVVGNCNGGTVTATAGSRTVSLTGGSLLAGNSCSIQVDVVPTAEGVYENETGQVTSTESGPDGTASATLIAANDLAVHKEFNPQSITAGGTSTLTITIFYPGPLANVTNVSVDDTLPNGVTVVNPGVTTGVCNGGTLTTTATTISLTGGSLAQGGYCSFDVPVTSSRPGTYPNTTGPVSSNETGQTTPSNTATLTVESLPAPTGYVVFHDPGLSKIGSPSDARLGETIIWTITVSNPSSVPMSPVFVNDPLPDILDIIGVTTTHGTATWAGQVVTADIGPLNPGETATITVESVTNNTALPGEVCNAASVQATMDSGAGPVTSTANMEGCITLYPLTLPQTGGSPVQSHRWQRALAALLLVGGALGAFAYRRRKRGASLLSR
ncbi:MAG TPA: DUF11 domain-containing protein, partial [Chloroflexi bacterium]|nr:DUF11 domain-containing protein [Chloroflexota bacterium]